MLPNSVRLAWLSAALGCFVFLSGCCGICGGRCQVYEHPEPSCCGLRYEGCCTCRDDLRDVSNQLTDILLP